MPRIPLRIIGLTLMLVTIACQSAAPTEQATVAPAATATQAAPPASPTPAPTNTTAATVTKVPSATPQRTATAEAKASATAQALAALVSEDLTAYGLSVTQGHLGWVEKSMRVTADEYGETLYNSPDEKYSAADFVLQTELTWNTSSGLAGCGLILRAEANFEKGKQYRLLFVRLQNLPLWDMSIYDDGLLVQDIRFQTSSALNDQQGSTNKIAVVAEGSKFTLYANSEKIGSITDNRLTQGRIGFIASQESGETSCLFENSWLWVLKDAK